MSAGGRGWREVSREQREVWRRLRKQLFPFAFRNFGIDFLGDSFQNLGLTFPAF
jgi:hypothetical protein